MRWYAISPVEKPRSAGRWDLRRREHTTVLYGWNWAFAALKIQILAHQGGLRMPIPRFRACQKPD